MSYLREPPPPSTNGWGRSLDREVTSIRRELDHMQLSASDREMRIRDIETRLAADHQIEQLEDLSARVGILERSVQILVYVVAVIVWRFSPDIAYKLLYGLIVR